MEKSFTTNEGHPLARWRVLMASTAIVALTGGNAWAAGAGEAQPGAQGSGGGYSTGAQHGERSQMGQAPGATEQPAPTGAEEPGVSPSPLYTMTVEELTGKEVVGPQGDKIGKVEDVVTGGPENRVHAIISVGGVLGVGATQVAVPLDELQLQNDKLSIAESEEQLKGRPEYKKEDYVQIEQKDRPLSESAAPESQGGQQSEPSEQQQEQEGESRY